jgi:hypothetical protein
VKAKTRHITADEAPPVEARLGLERAEVGQGTDQAGGKPTAGLPGAFYSHRVLAGLHDSPALDQAHEDHDHRHDQQDVNEATHGVRGNQPENPEHDQDERESHQHTGTP